ncbi:coproporphyrinogen III oxidase, aerobic [Thecamonas trahens ATCC 50062]|uniref:coproporphyrinogen oxidase n=1 Tax=Thecamonas trahens ATCC 50062 TaxID=461836 RepID=A0A0L0DRK5_THETB|nr:coproporphyrinogen III oxidase, aerobic [Thecamonas trahens ATCC 50062]KNC54964.1 coproporphyrinogen III oxidase, aerobic [Thecamonas trahens ATCC 50062]|eukprot:XP_013753411.1 coproporphyrinogen III oxidase, aerobic [Thecamonas trahens ATCC 50062]
MAETHPGESPSTAAPGGGAGGAGGAGGDGAGDNGVAAGAGDRQQPTVDEIEAGFRAVQDAICSFLEEMTGETYTEDVWEYEKGTGGGRTRVWEGGAHLEKAGVNWSGIAGDDLPPSAQKAFNIPPGTPYRATGVSLVIHPRSPLVPTIHANIRYFAAGDAVWWFGGGIDLTPYYPDIDGVIAFHRKLADLCAAHSVDYAAAKKTCDEYFFLPHRQETRGVGGLFLDHLNTDPAAHFDFLCALGHAFADLYGLFLTSAALTAPYSDDEREFQLYRRGRYVEFNLLFDRGTKFGIQSRGRTESILMSLPATVNWKYNWAPSPGSREAVLYDHYLRPQPWLDLTDDERDAMRLPQH